MNPASNELPVKGHLQYNSEIWTLDIWQKTYKLFWECNKVLWLCVQSLSFRVMSWNSTDEIIKSGMSYRWSQD